MHGVLDLLALIGCITERAVVRDVGFCHYEVRVPPEFIEALRAVFHMYVPIVCRVDLVPLSLHEAQYTFRITYLGAA